jgi:hypothetical protein
MGFGEIYWPVACALLTVFVITEAFHIGIGFWLHKRQEKKMEAMQADMQAQGIDPFTAALLGGASFVPPPGFNPNAPPEVPENGGPELKGEKNDIGGYL